MTSRRTRINLILATVGVVALATLGGTQSAFSQDGVPEIGTPTSSAPAGAANAVVVMGGTRLRRSRACASDLYELDEARGRCTHGPDLANDFARDIGSPPIQITGQPWPCFGTGSDGSRVQAIYVRQTGTTDNLAANRARFESIAQKIEAVYNQSAAKTGGSRFVRFVTTNGSAGCGFSISTATVTATAMGDFGTLTNELSSAGFNSSSRHYLVWLDGGTAYCGIGNLYGDDSSGQSNLNATQTLFASVTSQCWDYAEPHEIMHNLGGVQNSAPHSTGGYHCNDQHDYMCYSDGGPRATQTIACPSASPWSFDCNGDDYFSTAPPAGSYLATHWNTATSPYLVAGTAPISTTSTSIAATTTSTRATTSPTTQPATTQPATTQPATTQPATTQPATTQPATTTTRATTTSTQATTTTTRATTTTTTPPPTTIRPRCRFRFCGSVSAGLSD